MCGIGGCTIAQAKQRLGYAEFASWVRYRAKRGSLHLGMRVERGAATLASLYINSKLPKDKARFKVYDFMDHDDGPPISLEEAIDTWR